MKNFETRGILKVRDLMPADRIEQITNHFACRQDINSPGGRHTDHTENISITILKKPPLAALLQTLMGEGCQIGRVLFFNKTRSANWGVPWHQDRTIAVKERFEHPDFINWTMKNGIRHVEAPVEILEQMVTVRIHLDDIDENNGPLQVVTGSHLSGRLTRDDIKDTMQDRKIISCTGAKGTVYLVRPLLLHRSGKIQSTAPRRTLQLECMPAFLNHGFCSQNPAGTDSRKNRSPQA